MSVVESLSELGRLFLRKQLGERVSHILLAVDEAQRYGAVFDALIDEADFVGVMAGSGGRAVVLSHDNGRSGVSVNSRGLELEEADVPESAAQPDCFDACEFDGFDFGLS